MSICDKNVTLVTTKPQPESNFVTIFHRSKSSLCPATIIRRMTDLAGRRIVVVRTKISWAIVAHKDHFLSNTDRQAIYRTFWPN